VVFKFFKLVLRLARLCDCGLNDYQIFFAVVEAAFWQAATKQLFVLLFRYFKDFAYVN